MKRESALTGLLIFIIVAALIAGAIACWPISSIAPPTPWASGTGCPPSDHANPWCVR